MIGYKESDVGHMTKTIEMKVWCNCAQTTLMSKTLWHTDQGDTSSSDWLDQKGIRGIRLGHWFPHQSAFHLLTTTPPTMSSSAQNQYPSVAVDACSLWNLMDHNSLYLEFGTFHFHGRYGGRTCKRFDLHNHHTNAIGGGTLGFPTNQQVG